MFFLEIIPDLIVGIVIIIFIGGNLIRLIAWVKCFGKKKCSNRKCPFRAYCSKKPAAFSKECIEECAALIEELHRELDRKREIP